MKKVIITGVTGQDGSHMADYLLTNTDVQIFGAVRRLSVSNHKNISHISDPRFKLIDLDIGDPESVNNAIFKYKPDYFINLAANSFVGTSWEMPVNHMQPTVWECFINLRQLESLFQTVATTTQAPQRNLEMLPLAPKQNFIHLDPEVHTEHQKLPQDKL